jgi:prolipoprotein diacylglyceryl transferase
MTPVKIPKPPEGWDALHLGAFQIHAYALAILTGIFFAIWLTRRRWVARGGDSLAIEEIALWAIPFGIVGGRIYHVISTPGPYFGEYGRPLDAFKIWQGGLGIWGAVALGAVGALIGARRQGVSFAAFMDAAAPAILFAQAIGRIGNYFNQELFGSPTTLPWGLEVEPYQPSFPAEYPVDTLFHPTFLYEMLWNLAGVFLILYLDRKMRLRHGEVFWLYVAVYTAGRLWIEMLRIDEAVHVFGVRVNVWVSILVFFLGAAMFVMTRRKHAGEKVDQAPARNSKTVRPGKAGSRA